LHKIDFDNLGKTLAGELHKSFWQEIALKISLIEKTINSVRIQPANKNFDLPVVLYQNFKVKNHLFIHLLEYN